MSEHLSKDEQGEQAGVLSYVLLLAMGIGWGLTVSLGKIAGEAGGHPIGVALWQVGVSGSMLLALALYRYPITMPRKSVAVFSLFCGAIGVAFPAFALVTSALHLPAGIVAIAFASMPLITYLISVLFRVEDVNGRRLLGVVIGLGAMLLIILPDQALPEPEEMPWIFLCLAASLGMSIENVYAGGMRPPGISSIQLSCGRQFGAIFWLTPIALLNGLTIPLLGEWGALHWAATGAGVLSGACFTTLLFVIRTAGPTFGSQTAYIVTLAGVGWGMLLFGEQHSPYVWAALVLVLIGAVMVTPRRPRVSKLVTG